ncbi:MAG: hypothetical protein JXB48_13575 [Candidatus Latescibacteria bacterium]|nr:hypothetical protein [Candidatus Latescibacterota bacterium]
MNISGVPGIVMLVMYILFFLFVVTLAILSVLLPFFVFKIRNESIKTNVLLQKILDKLDAIKS